MNDHHSKTAHSSKDNLPSSHIHRPKIDIYASTVKRGQKFFVSASMENSRVISCFLDTGAEVSILPPHLAKGHQLIPLDEPMDIVGFDGRLRSTITHKVEVKLNFHPGCVAATFYVCAAPHPIVGSDLLQDETLDLSLETKSKILRVGSDIIHVKPTVQASVGEYKRRRKMKTFDYRREYYAYGRHKNWVRIYQRYTLPPNSITYVKCNADYNWKCSRSFLSLYDGHRVHAADGDIYVPSVTFEASNDKDNYSFIIPVANNTRREMTLGKMTIMGEIVTHDDSEVWSADCYSLREVLEFLEGREMNGDDFTVEYGITSAYDVCAVSDVNNPNSAPSAEVTLNSAPPDGVTLNTAPPAAAVPNQSPVPGPQFTPSSSPVPFSELIGQNKVEAAKLDKCRRDGINFDLKLDEPECQVEMELINDVDFEAEASKAESCPYWPDRDHFLSQFNFKDCPEEYLPRLHHILWSYRHTFYNESTPMMFRQGIKAKPIDIKLAPGKIPKKNAPRRISEEKRRHLQLHIETLQKQGVLEELDSAAECYASPLHLVVEKRWLASKNSVVEKSRVTCDMKFLNEALPDSSFPLPDCQQFRETVGQMGFKVFSNFDLSSCFHQFVISDNSKKHACVHALNRIYVYCRFAQGCKLSPPCAKSSAIS